MISIISSSIIQFPPVQDNIQNQYFAQIENTKTDFSDFDLRKTENLDYYQVRTDRIEDTLLPHGQLIDTDLTQLQYSYAEELSEYQGSVRVGLIDNGVLDEHEAFDTINIIQQDFNQSAPYGDMSHGTMVASAIVGHSNSYKLGLATNATIYSARMGTPTESPNAVEGDFIAAFQWLLDNNVSIINISLSGSAIPFEQLLEIANTENILIVGSAGNFGNIYTSNSGISQYPDAFSIGSIDPDRKLSYFSSFGYGEYYNDKIDFVHQGEDVITASSISETSYSYGTGTSFAAPLFTGALALLVEYFQVNNISYTADKIKALLATTALKPNFGQGLEMGYGLVNYSKAVELLQQEGFQQISTLDTKLPYGIRSNHLRGSSDTIPVSISSGVPIDELEITSIGNISKITTPIIDNNELHLSIHSNYSIGLGSYIGILKISHGNYSVNKSIEITVNRDKAAEVLLHLGYTDSNYDFINRLDGHNLRAWTHLMWSNGYHITESRTPFNQLFLDKYDVIVLPDFLAKSYFNDYYGNTRQINSSDLETLDGYIQNGGHALIQTFGNVKYLDGVSQSASSDTLNQYLDRHGIDITQPVYLHTNYTDPYTYISPEFPIRSKLRHISNLITPSYIRHVGGYIQFERNNPQYTTISSVESNSATEMYNTIVSKSIQNGSLTISTSDYFLDSCRNAIDRSSFHHKLVQCRTDTDVINEIDQHRQFNTELFDFLLNNKIRLSSLEISDSTLNVHSNENYTYELVQGEKIIQRSQGLCWQTDKLIDGEYSLYVYDEDNYLHIPIIVDTEPPEVSINSLSFLYLSRDNLSSYITIKFTDDLFNHSIIYVNSTKYDQVSIRNYIIETTDLGVGTYNLTMYSVDIEGNDGYTTFIIEIFNIQSDTTSDVPDDWISSTSGTSFSTRPDPLFVDHTSTNDTHVELMMIVATWSIILFWRRRNQ